MKIKFILFIICVIIKTIKFNGQDDKCWVSVSPGAFHILAILYYGTL